MSYREGMLKHYVTMVMPMFAETRSVEPDSFEVGGEDIVDPSEFRS